MSLEKKLFEECKNLNLHCSITYQRITDYSVEIYKGYVSSYQGKFYTDGHTSRKAAIKKALKWIELQYSN